MAIPLKKDILNNQSDSKTESNKVSLSKTTLKSTATACCVYFSYLFFPAQPQPVKIDTRNDFGGEKSVFNHL